MNTYRPHTMADQSIFAKLLPGTIPTRQRVAHTGLSIPEQHANNSMKAFLPMRKAAVRRLGKWRRDAHA